MAQIPPSHEPYERGLVTIERFLVVLSQQNAISQCNLSSATEARAQSGDESINRSVGRAHG